MNIQEEITKEQETVKAWKKTTPEKTPVYQTLTEYEQALNNLQENQEILPEEEKTALINTMHRATTDLNAKIRDINLTIYATKNGIPTTIMGRSIPLKRSEKPSDAYKRATGKEMPEYAKKIYDAPTWKP
jgi:hypothetical protein